MKIKRARLYITCLVVLVLVIVFYSQHGGPEEVEHPSIPLPGNPETALSARQYVEKFVKSKVPEAYLAEVVLLYPPNSIAAEGKIIRYGFVRELRRLWNSYWERIWVDVQAGTIVRYERYTGTRHLYRSPIEAFSQWSVDSDQALRIAEDNGGREFRGTHERWEVTLRGAGYWKVVYDDLDTDHPEDLVFHIDWNTGLVRFMDRNAD